MLYHFLSLHFHALCAIVASVAALRACIAIWAAASRRHWLWRALAVWGAITVLLPIRAYQPALVFTISSPLLIALMLLVNRIQNRLVPRVFPGDALPRGSSLAESQTPSTVRFSIRDLMLAMVIV